MIFTVSSLIKQVFFEKFFIIEYPYSSFPSGFSCDSLSASLTYLDDNNNYSILHNFTRKDFVEDVNLNWCLLKFDIEQVFQNNLLYDQIKVKICI